MDLRHLRCFVAVAEERNLTRAAARLHVAQPAVSQTLLALERSLGARLVDRGQRPLRLTAAGEHLLPEAYALLERAERTVRAVRSAQAGQTGILRVGFPNGGLQDLVGVLLRAITHDMPHVRLELRPLTAAAQLPAVRRGDADLVVARLTEPDHGPGLRVEPVRQERLLAMLPAGAPARPVDLADLADSAFAFFPRRLEPLVHDRYLAACTRVGFQPRIQFEPADAQVQALLVASGQAVALTGDGLSIRFDDVAYVPVRGAESIAQIALLSVLQPANPTVAPALAIARAALEVE